MAIIENIFVILEYRGKNIGKLLLDNLLNQLKELKCEYVCSLVEKNSEFATEFYIKNGFSRGINCVWLDKILSNSFKKF